MASLLFSLGETEMFFNGAFNINNVDLAIRFTVEDNKDDRAIPFLDTTVMPEANGGLSITV